MGKSVAKALGGTVSTIIDPFDIVSGRGQLKEQKARQQVSAAADAAASLARTQADEAAKKAEEDKKKAADTAAKTLEDKQAESRRMGINDYLIQEGGNTGRRRFLVGAK